jgi:hypothetical protein
MLHWGGKVCDWFAGHTRACWRGIDVRGRGLRQRRFGFIGVGGFVIGSLLSFWY